MDENNLDNQGSLDKEKIEQLEKEVENIGNKPAQKMSSQPSQPVQQPEAFGPPPPVVPEDTSSQGLKKSKGILWTALSLLLLAIVGAGAYYLSSRETAPALVSIPSLTQTPIPTLDPTADWKAYVDNGQKYSFSFPPNWVLSTGNPNQLFNYDPETAPGRNFDPELDKDKVKIEIYTSSKTYGSLEAFAIEQEKISEEIRGEPVERDYETIFIDDQRALKAIGDFPAGVKPLIIYIQNPSTKLMHTFVAMPRYDIHAKVVDQILATFEFTEATLSTTDWKTYTSAKYGFLVKYPSEWKILEVPNEKYQTETDEVWFESSTFPSPDSGARADVVFRITSVDPSANWQPQYFDNYKSEVYQAGEVTGTKISGTNKIGLFKEVAVIIKVGDSYIQALADRESESLSYFDQILSTFKFIEVAPSATATP